MTWSGQFDRIHIGGEWTRSTGSDVLTVVNPATEAVVATVPSATAEDAGRAVEAARFAFDRGPWPQMTVEERLAVLSRFRDLYAARQEDFARLISAEMGCPIGLSRTFQAGNPRLILEAACELAGSYPFTSVRQAETGAAIVSREPVGVVAAVVPWNVPQSTAMLKLAPALISGCAVILKPSPETPLDAYLLAELMQESGLPPGVLNILPADREASEALVSHPGVDKVAFTGSTGAGRHIAALCGQDLRRVTLELGGKSAAIFLDDADLEQAVEKLRFGSLRNSGQVCSLKTRLIVSSRRKDELVERVAELVSSMPVGDPADENTQIGPMVSARQQARVQGYIDDAISRGAVPVVGGGRPDYGSGFFVDPTVFTHVTPDDRIVQEEVFGPVLTILEYENEDEAVAIANHSDYGLNGAVFSEDLEHGLSVARRLRTGTVELNGNPAGLHAPMGGFKNSGIGREQGYEGFESYTEARAIGVPAAYAVGLV